MGVTADRPLTPRQEAFVRHYTTPGDALYNATHAARMAGYASKGNTLTVVGYENIRKPHIARAIRDRMAEMFSAAGITVDKILNDIELVRQNAIMEHNWATALKASELHGKHLMMFTERIEHIHTLEDTPLEELDRLAASFVEKLYGATLPSRPRADGSQDGAVPDPAGARTTH